MEVLYAKLYNKYSKLKKEKESRLDKLNHEQELKFMNYAAGVRICLICSILPLNAAADEMIEYLKSENDKLHGEVYDLKRSSSDEHVQCQKLLMEENKKNKELSEEISKLRKFELQECSNCAVNKEIESGQQTSRQDSPTEGTCSKYVLRSAKKRKLELITEGTANTHVDGEHGHLTDCASLSIQQPAFCQIKINSPGGDATDSNAVYCLFQCLVESVLGMKVSRHSQSSKPCIQALHQSSGYSFSLTWVPNTHGEAELLYQVLSLGTFEKVAPEWMREMLMFSTSMCSIFFQRLSRVINC